MTLQPFRTNSGFWSLRGVTYATSVEAPLGRLYWKIGPHYFGVDDAFQEPVIVRAYYDPTIDGRSMPGGAHYAGYMQFVQVLFNGQVVSPADYGGDLAQRQPYVDQGGTFVDFMGPAQAVVRYDNELGRLKPEFGHLKPFYAFNGVLLTMQSSYRNFATYPRPNGVLLLGPNQNTVQDQARCASLVAQLAPRLLTEQHISALLNQDNRLRDVQGDLAQQEPFEIALNDLMGQDRELQGLTFADLTGRVVGKYTLIEAPDPEGMPSTVCVYRENNAVKVHVLAYHEMASAETKAVMDSLGRMAASIQTGGQLDMDAKPDQPWGRGNTGLDALPDSLRPRGDVVEWKYDTYLFALWAQRTTRNSPEQDLHPMHGFTWSALQQFDPDAHTLTLTSIKAPQLLTSFSCEPALNQYFREVERCRQLRVNERPSIDVSNFTLAAMRMRDMGAGVKLRGVTANGNVANNQDGSPRT